MTFIDPMTPSEISRFRPKVHVRGPDECWPWLAKCNHGGYGQFQLHGCMQLANRIAYFLHHDIDPKELCALHTCDNPPYCNPKHLFLGTRKINNQDRRKKGRSAKQVGCLNHNCKLNERDIEEILESKLEVPAIAALFSISKTQVRNIKKGRRSQCSK